MNWGYRIALVYGGFVVFMLTLVAFASMQKDMHLVAPDYYKQEIEYQGQIDKMQNVKNLAGQLVWNYDAAQGIVQVTLPNVPESGKVVMFRPSDAHQDLKIDLPRSQEASLVIPIQKLSSGLWVLKLSWSAEGKPFYVERKMIIGKDRSVVWK